MKTYWTASGVDQEIRRLTYRTAGHRPATVSPVVTVREACRRLGKSRRQVYRYVRTGRLQPCAKVLDQWLFTPQEVDLARGSGLPGALRKFFWDVKLSSLSVEHHRDFILARLLELGDWDAARWVFRTYPRSELIEFLNSRGAEVLSKRNWSFWAVQARGPSCGAPPRSWRRRGRAWGGLG